MGILDDHQPRGMEYKGIKVIGSIDNLLVILPQNQIDEIAITLGLDEYHRRYSGIYCKYVNRTSIDELPQLFNILIGDMSLVGPRPERPQYVEKFKEEIPRYMIKHQVRSGLTGWAQINGYREIRRFANELSMTFIILKTAEWIYGRNLTGGRTADTYPG